MANSEKLNMSPSPEQSASPEEISSVAKRELGRKVNNLVINENNDYGDMSTEELERLNEEIRQKIAARERRSQGATQKTRETVRGTSQEAPESPTPEATTHASEATTPTSEAPTSEASTPEAAIPPSEAAQTAERVRSSEGAKDSVRKFSKKALPIALAALVATAAISAGVYWYSHRTAEPANPEPAAPPANTEVLPESNPFVGELKNGTKFDYTEYADREIMKDVNGNPMLDAEGDVVGFTDKVYWNANGYPADSSQDPAEQSVESVSKAPEFLAGPAYFILSDQDRKTAGEKIGINNLEELSPTELDDFMSDEANAKGGQMQEALSSAYQDFIQAPTTILEPVKLNGKGFTTLTYNDSMDTKFTPKENHFAVAEMEFENTDAVAVYTLERVESDKQGDTYKKKLAGYLLRDCAGFGQVALLTPADELPPDTKIIPADKVVVPDEPIVEDEEKPDDKKPDEEITVTTTPINPVDPKPDVDTSPSQDTEQKPAAKDSENLTRIDEEIKKDIAEDIGTKEVVIEKASEVTKEEITAKPTAEDFEGASPEIVENTAATKAETVKPEQESNDYSENRGGAHDTEYAPVEADTSAQGKADSEEIKIEEAPTGGQELTDILADLGIN